MNKYSIEDRVFLAITYYERQHNITETLRGWSTKHKNRAKPATTTVKALIQRFERTGSVADDKDLLKTAERTARTPDNIDAVKDAIEENPNLSIRSISRNLDLSSSSVQRILRKDLGIFPYKIQVGQRLERSDIERRFNFANEICQLIDEEGFDLNKIIFSDEAHFYLDGYVNRQNYRIWGSQKPEITITKPLHPIKVTVWAGICSEGFLGPIFLESNETVDRAVYNRILNTAFEEAKDKGWIDDFWFQQDGATPHIASENMALIRKTFGGRVISRNFPSAYGEGLAWPPYSPDLTPMDFFVWGTTKDKVYRNRPDTLSELRERIQSAFSSLSSETCRLVMENFEKRVRSLIVREGAHVEDIIH